MMMERVREFACSFIPRCLRPRPDRSGELAAVGEELKEEAGKMRESADRIKHSGDIVATLAHSMRNKLVEKTLLDPEPEDNGNPRAD